MSRHFTTSAKLRQIVMIAERRNKGYGHFTTRTSIPFMKLVGADLYRKEGARDAA